VSLFLSIVKVMSLPSLSLTLFSALYHLSPSSITLAVLSTSFNAGGVCSSSSTTLASSSNLAWFSSLALIRLSKCSNSVFSDGVNLSSLLDFISCNFSYSFVSFSVNGEITREQVDGFIEQDESVITDIERKAESENEAELNSAIDQADKLIGEAVTRSEGKTEPSNEKVEGGEVKKTVLTKRLYEGKIRESVKSALEEYGLTREVENQSIAEKKGKQFVEEFGEDVSLDAIKSGDISGGEAVVVLDEVAKSLERKMLTENDPVKMSELVAKQAEVINTLENIARKGGQFNAMLKKVYQNSDLGYNYETKVSEWKAENSGFIPKEVEARFKELDTQMKDLRKRIAETELKLREAEEKQAFDNIVAEVRHKPKTERSGKRKIAEGLDELTNALGVKLSAVGDKKASATKALIKIGEGLIEEGIDTAKNVAEKIREYVEDKFKGKIDIKEYESDVIKHFEETLPKITERNGKIHIPDKLIKELVKNGAETIEDLVSQVKEIAKADFPDITDREIRDSITKYGKTQNPTKDELLAKISRMKRIGQLISKLEDVQNKIRPLKSGLQRERMDAEERALNKKLREEMKELPVDEETLAGQIRTVLDARKQGVQNRIEDLQREIEQGEKTPKNQRTIADDEALTKLKEQLEKVKTEHQEKFADQNEAEKEAKRLSMAKKNTQNRIEELSKRLREGDFSKVEKKRLEPDLELSKLRFEKEKIQHEYDKEFEKDRLLKRTKMEKFGDFALEAWGMSRILKATADLSFIYVQGKYALTHPKIASKAFVQAMKLFASEKRAEKFIEDIRTSELYPTMKDSKLSIPEPNAKINASEELSYSGWLNSTWKAIGYPLKYVSENAYENWDKVNPLKAFERASIGYLNTVRVLRFADGVKMLELRGQTLENSPKEYKNMADFVNTFTGRASLGSLEQQSEMLARVFFSPRNWASVFKQSILLPRQMYKWRETGDEYTFSVAQKMAFRDVSAWVGLSTTMATLAGAVLNNDDDKKTGVEKDIRSTDFAKIKLGDTRVDPFGGYLSPIIMASRIAMDITHEIAPKYSDGGYKNKDGKIVPLGKGYVPTKKELLEQVAINKLNPSTSALYSYLAKKEKNGEWVNEYGKPYDFKEDLKLYPMMADMIMEIYLEDPTALNGLLTFGAYFGLPVSKYGEDTNAQRKKKELEKKKD